MKTVNIVHLSLSGFRFGISLLLWLGLLTAVAQTKTRIQVVPVSDKTLTDFALNSELFVKKRASEILIRVFEVKVDQVSPFAVETDEVDSFLYVLTSTYGEVGTKHKTHLYKVGPFFAPKLVNWIKLPGKPDNFLLFSYLTRQKKYGSLAITTNGVTFIEGKPTAK